MAKKKPICNVGDRISTPTKAQGTVEHTSYTSIKPYKIRWENGLFGIYSAKDFDKYGYTIHPPEPTAGVIQEKEEQLWQQFGIEDIEQSEEPCNLSKLVACSRDKEASPVQLSLLAGLTGESPSKTTKMRSQSLNQTSIIKSLELISESFVQDQANMICSVEDSLVQTPAEPGTELELLTYLQNLEPCSASSSDVSEKPSPNSSFWNSLRDLSIEDLERGLEDCEWEDIKASIQSSRQLINLKRSLRGKDCLSFPTLLSGRGRGCRDAGLVECEKWWKKHVIQTIGSQLSAEAIACLHGFPSNWYRGISPASVAQPDTQADLQPESLEVKPLLSPKQGLPLNGSSGCGPNFSREWQIGDRVELVETMEFNRRKLGETGTVTEVRNDGGVARITITWDKKRPKLNNSTVLLAETKTVRLIDQSPASHQSEANLSDSLIGHHFYIDSLEVIAQAIAPPQNWRETPDSPIIQAVKVRPWWNKLRDRVLPESLLVPLDELTEVTDFSESPSKLICGDSTDNSLENPESLIRKEPRWWVGDRLIGELNTGEIIESTLKEVHIMWTNSKGGKCGERYPRHQLKHLTDFQYEEAPTKEKDSRQIGSLYWYTKNVADKTDTIQIYPKWDGIGERPKPQQLVKNDEIDRLWYWGYSYVEKELGKWRDKSAAVPRKKLSAVRQALRDGKPHTYILKEILGK